MQKRHQLLILAVALLLVAGGVRLSSLGTLPPGFSPYELETLTITHNIEAGQVQVFDSAAGGYPQETFFHVAQAFAKGLMGNGLITLRQPALWSSLLTLALLYTLTRRLYGGQAALLALGLMAVGFWPGLLGRLSLRETLVPLFTLLTLLALVNVFHIRWHISPEAPNTLSYSLLGFTLAVSLYVHWSSIFLAIFVTLTVIYLFVTRQPISRRSTGTIAFGILLSIILVIPYVATTFGDPANSGLAAMRVAMTPPDLLTSIVDGLAAIFPMGDSNPVTNIPGRPLIGPVLALLVLTGLIQSIQNWRRPAYFLPTLALLIGLIPLLLSREPGSFLAMGIVLPLLYMIAASAGVRLYKIAAARQPRLRPYLPWAITALILFNLLWTSYDLAVHWRTDPVMRDNYGAQRGLLAHHLDQTAGQEAIVVCSPRLQDTAEQLGDPTLLALMMHRPVSAIRYVDCANGLILAEGGAPQQFAFTEPTITERMHPALVDWLFAQPGRPVPGLEERSVLNLDIQQTLEDKIGSLLTTAPIRWAPEAQADTSQPPSLPVRFGGNITFLGYDPSTTPTFAPGDIVPVVSYWRADGDVPPDLRIFTHVLSDPSAIVAQSSAMNTWPVTLRNRDVFLQINYNTLPESLPSGTYYLSIGAYQADTALRLPVFDGERVRGDRLFMYQITVADPTTTAVTPADHDE